MSSRAGTVVWLNGTHGVGKTTTSRLVAAMLPGARVLDAEKVGEVLMDVRPPLPELGDFQHWTPWRPLVVETAARLLAYAGGPLVMPMTVLDEGYWQEIAGGLDARGVAVRHFVLHAGPAVLRQRIADDEDMGPSDFRLSRVEAYGAAVDGWLGRSAEVMDTEAATPEQVAERIAARVLDGSQP